MRGWRVYRQNKTVIADGTDDLEIEGEKVAEDCILEITQMSIFNHSTANKHQELGFLTLADVEMLLTADDGSQNYSSHMRGIAYLEAGERPFGRVESPTNQDQITLSVHGKLWPA